MRCRICGQLLLPQQQECPRCNPSPPPESPTHEDTTPFARSQRRDRHARRAMCRWLYAAGTERLAFLALVPPSAASRAFARRHLWMLVLATIAFQLAHTGWHQVVRTPDNAALLATVPAGRHWHEVVIADATPTALGLVALWWNPVQALIGLAAALIAGLTLAFGLMGFLQLGTRVVLPGSVSGDGRLRGAMRYSTAWAQWVCYAALLLLLIPARDALEVVGLPLLPPAVFVYGVASVFAGVAALMWWFWLTRLAMTVPAGARPAAVTYYAVVMPLLAAGLVIGWRIGQNHLFARLWEALHLTW